MLPETNWGYSSSSSRLAILAAGFEPISLEEMDAVALLNRRDIKFVLSNRQLLSALQALEPDYRILSIDGQKLNLYRTLYFDTPDFALYRMHVNGRANRYKVRSREYTDTHQSFLEVKHKTPKDRTIKNRFPTDQPLTQMTRAAENWLHSVYPYDSQALEPKIWSTFTRITLVSRQHCERVTLDVNLTFYTAKKVVHLDGVAIVEVKMEANHHASSIMEQMHVQRIQPQGFSKYCIGVSLLYDGVKKNALKPKLLRLEKMSQGGLFYE
jgi:hypothetical protein